MPLSHPSQTEQHHQLSLPRAEFTATQVWRGAALGIIGLTTILLLWLPTDALWLRLLAALTLTWWLPGSFLVALWRPAGLDAPAAGVLALGLGLGWMMTGALVLHWLPGAIALWRLVTVYGVGALVLCAALWTRPPLALDPTPRRVWIGLCALLLVTLALRLPGLGYHDLHVDEVSVLRSARRAIKGEAAVLAEHTKGPGEIAVALVTYRALGTMNEWVGRLPFGLLSVGSVLALTVLGGRMFAWSVGLWAGLLLACNGFALGLSRIVQYQAGMLLLSALAVLAGWEFGRRGERRWLALTLLLGACGLILHYELALLGPLLLWLLWRGWRVCPPHARRSLWRTGLIAAGAGTALVAACYVPLLLHPNFARTQGYLGNRVGDSLNVNIAFFVEMGTFYNATWFFAGLLLLTLAGLVLGWRTQRLPTLALLLWFVPYLILYLFIMRFPGTHFYMLMPSWSLLAALPLRRFGHHVRAAPGQRVVWSRVRRGGALALLALWLGVSVGYLYLLFFRQQPEYVINYPQTRVPLYWAPYGDNIPQEPRFGFPIREGWKTIGVLADWGYLGESYSSNERSRHLRRWYVESISRRDLDQEPDYVFVARHIQQADPTYDDDLLEAAFTRVGEVRVRNEPRIQIWARTPLPVSYVTYHAEHFANAFDARIPPLTPSAASAGSPAVQNGDLGHRKKINIRDGLQATPENRQTLNNYFSGAALNNTVSLRTARFAPQRARPGDVLHIELQWETAAALMTDYKVFVHVADETGKPLAQWDGMPGLNTTTTSQWIPGQPFSDHIVVPLPPQLAAGDYRILTGLYDPASGARLGDRAIEIGRVRVQQRVG